MKHEKQMRLFGSLLVTVSLFAVSILPVYADDRPSDPLICETFSYMGAEAPEQSTFYYSDSYFRQSSYETNEHLRTFSISAVMSASSNSETDAAYSTGSFVTDLLSKAGFGAIEKTDMGAPAKDTIGTVISMKKIGDHDVVSVIVRGAEYDSE